MKKAEKGRNGRERLFVKSRVPNLVKYAPTGRYYARAKLGGNQVYESLRTFDYEVAELRLAKFMEQMRKRRAKRFERPKAGTFKELFDEYERRIDEDRELAESSKTARRYTLKRLKTTWPGLEKIRPSRLSVDAVARWAKKLKVEGTNFTPPGAKKARKGNSSSTVNKTIQTLARIMDLAVSHEVSRQSESESCKVQSVVNHLAQDVILILFHKPTDRKAQELPR